jgi:hypothetical protein
MTSDQILLQEHLNNIAKEDKASGNLFSVVTDLEHWADSNIHTVAEFEHYDAQSTHYESYREVHNIKPTWINYSAMTTEEIRKHTEILFGLNIEENNKNSQIIQERKAKNKYQPNLIFSNLKELVSA